MSDREIVAELIRHAPEGIAIAVCVLVALWIVFAVGAPVL